MHVVAAPDDELTRIQKRLRYAFELVSHCRGELIRVRAEGMAAELTYRTIFSLIPVVVLALIMFRIVGGVEEVQARVENQLYSFFGVPDIPDVYDDKADASTATVPSEDFSSTYKPLSQKLDELTSSASSDAQSATQNTPPNPPASDDRSEDVV